MNIQYYSGVLASVIRGVILVFKTYKNRVLADLGIVTSDSNTIAYMKMSKQQSINKSINFAWLGEAGSTIRTSGIYSYFTKLYSLLTTNDAIQTTSTSQPFVGGNIAPNEHYSLKNPNGGNNFMPHSVINFATTDAWSITTIINTNGSDVSNMYYASGVTTKFSNFYYGTAKFRFINSLGTSYLSTNIINGQIIGKNCVVTRVADGLGNLKTYINGVFLENQIVVTSIELTKILDSNSSNIGSISSHIIRAQALTSTQVLTEATFLRNLYPDIPSITIGSQVWATSNCDMVCTPQGNLIANVTDNTIWTSSQTLYDNAYAATAGTVEQKTYAAVKAASMWCHYNNDSTVGSVYGKLYNWFAVKLLQMDIDYYNVANPTSLWGYRVPAQADYTALSTYLGGDIVSGGKMKKEGLVYWNSPNTGADNNSRFSAIGTGRRYTDGTFSNINIYSWFRMSDIGNTTRYVRIADSGLGNGSSDAIQGCALRLIKN